MGGVIVDPVLVRGCTCGNEFGARIEDVVAGGIILVTTLDRDYRSIVAILLLFVHNPVAVEILGFPVSERATVTRWTSRRRRRCHLNYLLRARSRAAECAQVAIEEPIGRTA